MKIVIEVLNDETNEKINKKLILRDAELGSIYSEFFNDLPFQTFGANSWIEQLTIQQIMFIEHIINKLLQDCDIKCVKCYKEKYDKVD